MTTRYLGSSVVVRPSGEEATADAIRAIVSMVAIIVIIVITIFTSVNKIRIQHGHEYQSFPRHHCNDCQAKKLNRSLKRVGLTVSLKVVNSIISLCFTLLRCTMMGLKGVGQGKLRQTE